ncbi:MAG: hypothetical protein RLZZ117_88 [Cyanobacteriota bacterium]|jgi:hypothetical protein
MARKLRAKKGRENQAKRNTIADPVFGRIKDGRVLRRYLMRSPARRMASTMGR